MYYDQDIDLELEHKGCSFTVNISYAFSPATGFSDDPWGAEVEFGQFTNWRRQKPISRRLQSFIEKNYGDTLVETICEREQDQ